MKNKYKKRIFIILSIVIFIILIVLISRNYLIAEKKVSTIEIFENIEKIYDGEIIAFEKNKKNWHELILQRNARDYKIIVDGHSGEVIQMSEVTNSINTPTILSVKEIEKTLQKQYTGSTFKIELVEEKNQINYYVDVITDNREKYLVMDAKTGEVISEEKNKKINQPLLTEDEAKSIAKKNNKGKVINIAFNKSTSGGNYLVSLQQGGKIIIVQIHAMSGDIISTTVKKGEAS